MPGKGKDQEKHGSNSPGIAGRRNYQLQFKGGGKAGIKARRKIRIATGKRAKGNRRARVIMEVPQWPRQHKHP